MRRALSLAANGPRGINPRVGCVLADAAGRVVAEGWHRGVGTPHAEVDALSQLPTKPDGAPDATGLTAYVTLEPCNHTGHTGPCSRALVAAGVSRVVYALDDPNPAAGGGADTLRVAGVAVEGGVDAEEAAAFLRAWLITVREQRPFVTVKWASSLDGRAAAADGTSQWITGTAARQRVHEQRAAHDAIAVGTGTVLADDPSLTARADAGELSPKQPVPVVIGERAVPADARLRRHPKPLVELRTRDLRAALADLFERGIRSLYVEGGPTLASAFVAAGLVDDLLVYLAPTIIGGPRAAITDAGVATIANQHRFVFTGIESLGEDVLITAQPAPRREAPKEQH
ncbi:bifunctional diaminohydroxyphosphoribosylaminopyrimidine deaminase/5-amino-6-(5-phosphoribosylamino)uracil reductase RibD [Galbitalea sp. SE-J8]|uniref:bifunctional diaminohydroxyphosphoribosylaminopyrimidine deaminase/5-amino-6-(5-phosphoribosylamino)uracil reductase RibD n=1 Tax=Galbitalea sp. SE-J8 TaxID=3054952 RepID=UPI00259CE51F|nr:bifunctional diaminohydroxyphosphoribosylaminopyrimidine deaminase/5-amino-6-(5-phosphoribosylamino)uracil reductase RibD [Galbitalea sp. SE-J8]MDM4763631.1 bifunctional diaminohydroxyphosphoribosylaminopyrimidine deaminase/5-amino-6-(5-phosphoribosylamino)uracil reductase RibD [Galbitalea sp. SE-J8]